MGIAYRLRLPCLGDEICPHSDLMRPSFSETGTSPVLVLSGLMTVGMRVLLVAASGASGAAMRYLVGIVALRVNPDGALGTLIVNLLGCFCFGLVSQLEVGVSWLTPQLRLMILTGFLGAFTTFSTYSFDTIQLLETRGWGPALTYILTQNILGIGLAWGGMALGRSVS
jgi:CrcB protein